jgi:hypothetical protein
MMNKSKIEKQRLEQKPIKAKKAGATSVRPSITKPNVVRRFSREELISICQGAVVHHTKWQNRDSYSAQKGIQSIYKGLTAGLKFRVVTKKIHPDYHSSEWTLIIEFLQPIDFDKLETGLHLDISSREDYFKDCCPDYECEMFDGDGIDFQSTFTQTYMPSRQKLESVGTGNDWY